ncbi:hypothetical protein [uncultured Streptococcus sp.]|uniref:hypothetical protein n=1 Tax=uncultured Streptococcus sp. TaxID=83427 RepID=UPI00259B7299|nr:hypothetical protein [uncultured Streptococcus sp.]
MKKVFKSIKFWIFVLLVILAGGWFIQYEIHKHEISQFVEWKPRPNIVDSQFIAGGKAVAIQWDNKKEVDEATEANSYNPNVDVIRFIGGGNSERYIAQESYKLKSQIGIDSYDSSKKIPYLSTNKAQKGEYWLIDVYDTKDKRLVKKTYDVFKIVRDMNKNYIPLYVRVSSMMLDTDDGETYIPIDILVDKKDKYIVEPGNIYVQTEYQSRTGLMNVKDGKIAWKTSSGKGYEQVQKDSRESDKDLHPFEYNFGEGQLQLQHSRLLYTARSDEAKYIPLKTLYPKVYSILRKGNDFTTVKWDEEYTEGENAYLYFLGPEDLNFDISFLELLYPGDRSGGWYDVLQYHKIPAELSKDGQEHHVNNKKEFFQYFKKELNQSKDATEFSLLRRLYEVQNYVVSRDFGKSFGNLTIPADYSKDGKVHVVQNDEEFFKYMDLEKIPNKKMKEDIIKRFSYDIKK